MNEFTRHNVLIVDDETKNLRILGDMLSSVGAKVAMSRDGISAINFVKKSRPDIMLLDVLLPGVDGYEICRMLKQAPDTKELPVILISALSDTADIVKGFEAGCVDYITKPFHKSEVLARVNAHLQLKNARERLESVNEQLSTVNASKDKLFTVISRNLHASINELNDMLKGITEQPAGLCEIIGKASGTSRQISDLLENLLLWARIHRGEIDFHPQETDIGQIVETVMEDIAGMAETKSIRLSSEINATLPVFADVETTLAITRNLIENAIKFTPEFGVVVVSTTQSEEMVEISVADTGIGMDADIRNRLFRLENHFSTLGTGNEKGTGLGLLLCKELVEKNGGKIFVESKPGEGSRFAFTLPKKDGFGVEQV